MQPLLLLYSVILKKRRRGKISENLKSSSYCFLLMVIFLCLSASYRLINFQTTVTLLIFNAIFFSLIFQLNGSVLNKAFVLAIGNIVGLLLNLIFYNFSMAGYEYFGITFNAFYTLIYPFFNLMWIVPFWVFKPEFFA